MAHDRQVPNLARIIERLDRRVSQLERELGAIVDSRRLPTPFSFAGIPDEDVQSPPWRPVHPVSVDLMVPQVNVAPAGGDMTIDMKLNGTLVRTLTIPEGDLYVEDAVPFVIPTGYVLTATVTLASDAEDLAIAVLPRLL